MKKYPSKFKGILAEIILLFVIFTLLLTITVNLSRPVTVSAQVIKASGSLSNTMPQAINFSIAGVLSSQLPLFTPILNNISLPIISK